MKDVWKIIFFLNEVTRNKIDEIEGEKNRHTFIPVANNLKLISLTDRFFTPSKS